MPKFLKQVNGQLTEENTVGTSAGAADANKVPHLNGNGVLDASIVNGKNTSAGASDAGKVPLLNANGVLDATIVNSKTTSVGAGDSGKLVALDSAGRIDSSMMPVGIGADTGTVQASEALAAGDYVNIWSSGGSFRVRKADANTPGKEAHGFVLQAVASGGIATVYFEGTNTQVTGQAPGVVYLDLTTPGRGTDTVPTGAGKVLQIVGYATSSTSVNFQATSPITLA